MHFSTEVRITRMIFTASFLVSTVILVLLSLNQPIRSNIAAGYLCGFILVAGVFAMSRITSKHRKLLHFFLLISVLNLMLVPPEVYLRLRGFHYESGIQFGYPRPYQFSPFVHDPDLFWKFPQSSPGINSYGFRSREVERPKPPGKFRILFLGNSCTYQGFPGMIELILRDIDPGVECLNFAIPGYTSYQGKMVMRKYMDQIDPDLVVISYGWNDRWLAYGTVDSEKEIGESEGAGAGAITWIYSRWKLLQFLRQMLAPVMGRSDSIDSSRVPLEQFRENLDEICLACENHGIQVVLSTEPSSHLSLGVPDFVVESGYAESKRESLKLLKVYNDAVREVATGEGRHLVDIDKMISGRRDVREIFTADGLHFSTRGLALVASIESRYIASHFLEE
jgi:lysophospholipase L1-like esterase